MTPDDYSSVQDSTVSNDQVFLGKPKKSKKTMYVILGVVLFVLVIAATVVFLLFNKGSVTNDKKKLLTSLEYVKTFQAKTVANNDVAESVYESKDSSYDVIYKIKDGAWIASDDMANVATFSIVSKSIDTVKSSYEALSSTLKSDGLSEMTSLDYGKVSFDASKSYAQYFASEDMVCNLRNIPQAKSDTVAASYTVRLDCASLTDFDANKLTFTPFIEAYDTSKDKLSKEVVISNPEIQASGTDNYKTASLGLTSVVSGDVTQAKFYQTPEGKWYFFSVTQDQDKVSCSDYSSEGLVNAYVGYTCWDTAKNESSFVAKPNPTFEIVPGAKSE